jgi:phage virion morphogenesis protein
MRGIATELASQTEQNFENEGRPQWPELSDTTTERRSKNGHWPGRILQVSAAGLAASITTHATDSSALIGSNKPYAAMMQLGGDQADFPHLRRHTGSAVPADGCCRRTAAEAEQALLELALSHLKQATRGVT